MVFPSKMIVDNAKEMKLGELAQKCKEAHCYMRSTEPYSPWSNSSKHEIREIKKGAAMGVSLRQWSRERLPTLALSANLAFGIGLSSGAMVLLFHPLTWYLARTWAPVLM
jgi:hypothetical protein